jgi:hypothetical protein
MRTKKRSIYAGHTERSEVVELGLATSVRLWALVVFGLFLIISFPTALYPYFSAAFLL